LRVLIDDDWWETFGVVASFDNRATTAAVHSFCVRQCSRFTDTVCEITKRARKYGAHVERMHLGNVRTLVIGCDLLRA
jgi:hypothetical protein